MTEGEKQIAEMMRLLREMPVEERAAYLARLRERKGRTEGSGFLERREINAEAILPFTV